MTTEAQFDVNSRATIVTLVLIGSFAAFVLLTAPALVGAFLSQLQLTPQQAGYLISADMAGMGLATVPALVWLNRLNWRKVALVALLLNAVCHLISALLDNYHGLLAARFCAGLFAGSAMSVCLASLGLTREKDRNFGFWVVGQLVLGAAGLALLPRVTAQWGVQWVYLFAAVCVALLSAFVGLLPQGPPRGQHQETEAATRLSGDQLLKAILGITAVYSFYAALSGVWAYLERIGFVSGLGADEIGQYLSIASLAGVAGALSASCFGHRFGRSGPVSLGFVVIFGSLLMLLGEIPALRYLLAACLFKYAWTFILPFVLAALSAIDSSGRVIVTTNIFIGGGLATGPALAATLIEGQYYTPIIWFGMTGMLLSFLFVLPLIARRNTESCASGLI